MTDKERERIDDWSERAFVYIAGPYKHPDPVANTRAALDVAEQLSATGLIWPVIPHLDMFWRFAHPHPDRFWYEYDTALLSRCDAMLRLPGSSIGADAEEEIAKGTFRLPIFESIDDVVTWVRGHWSTRGSSALNQPETSSVGIAESVAEFHRTFRLVSNDRPTKEIDANLAALRQRLLVEEVDELEEAVTHDDIVAIADALGDIVYVAYGTALTYGIPLDEVLAEIHSSNMSKLGADGAPVYEPDGKVGKSGHYRPPNITEVLERSSPSGGTRLDSESIREAVSPRISHGASNPLGQYSSSHWFDSYVMVDWSANNSPKTGADSIWVGRGEWSGNQFIEHEPDNFSTRHECMEMIAAYCQQCIESGSRVMIGFDFPFSYPTGIVHGVPNAFGDGPQWLAIWRPLSAMIQDSPENQSNRFEVANELNRRSGSRLFWGRPRGRRYDALSSLSETDSEVPGLIPIAVSNFRRVEKTTGSGIKSVWQLFGGVTVGSQSLVGIPRLEALRTRFGDKLKVWPFDTGFTNHRDDFDSPVTLVEIWPTAIRIDYSMHEVRDAAQVLSVVRWCSQRDVSGDWPQWLNPRSVGTNQGEVMEEGWILGVK